MLGPYRESVSFVADPLPRACVPAGSASHCPRNPPQVRQLPGRYAAILSASMLLLISLAAPATVAWAVLWARDAAPVQIPAGPLHWASTHRVDAIWARAQRKAARGSWLTLARATVAPGAFSAGGRGSFEHRVHVAHEPRGLRLMELQEGSPETLLGLRAGDLVTAINGYALRRPTEAFRAYHEIATGRGVVVELLREGKPVALRVDWSRQERMK